MIRTTLKQRRVLGCVLGLLFVFVGYDYVSYHSRYEAAISIAKAHGARIGSLLDWPCGRECRITFDEPLDRDAVTELAVLNSLAARHWVGVTFSYDMLEDDFQHACETLSECQVCRFEHSLREP